MQLSHGKIKRLLFNDLGSHLQDYGFTEQKYNSFNKQTEFGFFHVGVSLAPHRGYTSIMVYIGVRHDSVENIVNEYYSGFPENLKNCSYTIGNNIMNFDKSMKLFWFVSNEDDIVSVSNSIFSAIKTIAFPFFERFSSLEEVYQVKVTNVPLYSSSLPGDAVVVVTIAYLLDHKDDYPELVKKFHLSVEESGWPSKYLEEFECLVAELDRRWSAKSSTPVQSSMMTE